MILSCQNIAKSFGGDDILVDVSFQLEAGAKLAIVGPNGCGKSTLLKIIMGQLEADNGTVVFAKDTTVGYLAQYQADEQDGTIYEIVRSACGELIEMEEQLHTMEAAMTALSGQALDEHLVKYHALNDKFNMLGGNTYESEIVGVLRGLGFAPEEFDKTMSQLSGGQKTRVSLGKLLVKKPDILLLDEPINHLDLSSIQWLENYLLNYKGTVVIVAHDRFFLDRIVDHVLDVHRDAKLYKGNYTAFVSQKSQWQLTQQRAYEKQQAEIAHQQQVITKLKQFNREKSIKRAESRQKALDKVELIDKPIEEDTAMRLSLEPTTTSGNDVLMISNLSKAYGSRVLFENTNLQIQRGEHVAIIGDNGTGKTTLLKIINNMVNADSGEIRLGANVTIGYYDQEQQVLDDSKTLFDEMSDAYPGLNNTRIRNVLAAFMFTGDDCYKRIGNLSGGERGRISLAKLMLSGANLLILDEPTNHLDMESKGILENALNSYTGTLLYVSHDRYFINQTAHRILDLRNERFTEYLGNYDYYLEKFDQLNNVSTSPVASTSVTNAILASTTSASPAESTQNFADNQSLAPVLSTKLDWQEQKRLQAQRRKVENQIKKVEEEIANLEDSLAAIDESLADPSISTNSAKLNQLTAEQTALKEKLELAYESWEELSENEILS